MPVTVRLFAGLRERAGTARVELVDTGADDKLTTVVRARAVTP